MAPSNSSKPWEHAKPGGSEADALTSRFVASLDVDKRLYAHDIAGSIAHARMLAHVGLITAADLAAIEHGLAEIKSEIDTLGDAWPGWKIELEDVHMCLEAALVEKVGDPGRKLHTGRSRNDQVALDLLMWTRDAEHLIGKALDDLIKAFEELAHRQGHIVLPSYTHLQRAQPITVGGEAMAWHEAFTACCYRTTMLPSMNYTLPLGSGAIAGSSLPLDRGHVAQALEFSSISQSSIHATATRDVAIDFAYALSITALWLSRWAEQWIIYMTTEFGFLRIGDAYTTGSSMMPQKRNPDMLELIRGRCAGVYGHLVSLLTMCKGLPIGYNRDLQEDKRHVFAAFDTVQDMLAMAARIVRSAHFNEDKIKPTLDRGYLDATSLAEYLVTRGVPFRTAHQIVGHVVRTCDESGRYKLAQLSVDELNALAATHGHGGKVGPDVGQWLGAENVVKRYQSSGNAGVSGFTAALSPP